MVERSLFAAERSVWVAGVVDVGRGDWVWLVSGDVVVAVDMGTWDLLGEGEWRGPAAQTGGGTIRKSPWMATVLGAKDGRLATRATIEPSAAEKGSAGRKCWTRDAQGRMDLLMRMTGSRQRWAT